jgi:anti-anti-sigma factor
VDITARQLNQATIITIVGSIDALSATEVTQFCSERLTGGQHRLVIDLSQVNFMSSAGLRAILTTLKESRQLGGDLRLAGAQPGIEKVLKMSGFTTILKVFASVDEAAASFS